MIETITENNILPILISLIEFADTEWFQIRWRLPHLWFAGKTFPMNVPAFELTWIVKGALEFLPPPLSVESTAPTLLKGIFPWVDPLWKNENRMSISWDVESLWCLMWKLEKVAVGIQLIKHKSGSCLSGLTDGEQTAGNLIDYRIFILY